MNIGLLSILHNRIWDFRQDMAQTYADALRNAIELQLDNDIEKQHGYFLSKKGYKDKDGNVVGAGFEDKLYVGNIHRIEDHLYCNDEELQDDDQIIDVVVVDGPITRDGGGCSYGSKDWRNQVMYANTIPQVVGHLFLINTPGGEAASRNDYEMMINDCREKGKPTVAFVDGMCCSSGINLACRCDRVVVMNPRDEVGCIGTMAAFWAVAHDTVDQDGYRYVELVGKDCPEKNAWWREAAKGEYDKLQKDLDKDTEEFHNTVRENRPLVTDDMLSGKVFEAQEVIPALVDEIGDMDRAIECVFALADENMKAARFMTAPEPDGEGGEPDPGKEPENNPEESTHQNKSDMTDEEKKAQEAAAAQAAEQEAAEKAAQEAAEKEAEEKAAQEAAEKEAQEAAEKEAAEKEAAEKAAQEAAEKEAAEKKTIEDAQAEIDRITETLHNAEQMIADKDKKIEELAEKIAGLTTDNESKAAAIEGAKAQTEQLQADVDASRKSLEEANSQLSTLNSQLTETVTRAAMLEVTSCTVTMLNKRDHKTKIASQAVKLQFDFIIAKNITCTPGMKDLYVRVMDPMGNLLNYSEPAEGEEATQVFAFESENIPYSITQQFEYGGEALEGTCYCPLTNEIEKGFYTVDFFCEGNLIGSFPIQIKK